MGDIGNNNGAFAEEYFFNAISKKMVFAGIKYDYISNNLKNRRGSVEDEFDMVLFNGTAVAIIETKYRVHKKFLDELTTKKIENFRTLFPAYAKHKIYLGIASMSFNSEIQDYAHELGIAIIKQNGDTFEYDTTNMIAY